MRSHYVLDEVGEETKRVLRTATEAFHIWLKDEQRLRLRGTMAPSWDVVIPEPGTPTYDLGMVTAEQYEKLKQQFEGLEPEPGPEPVPIPQPPELHPTIIGSKERPYTWSYTNPVTSGLNAGEVEMEGSPRTAPYDFDDRTHAHAKMPKGWSMKPYGHSIIALTEAPVKFQGDNNFHFRWMTMPVKQDPNSGYMIPDWTQVKRAG